MDELTSWLTDELQTDDSKHRIKKQGSPFKRNLIISCCLLAIVVAFLLGYSVFQPDGKTNSHDFIDIQSVCELVSLECRFHNVAVHSQEGNLFNVGKVNIWLEFDEIVNLGIDVDQVRIESPTEDGVVRIYLPPAEILSCSRDTSTISKPVCDLGPFTDFSGEDELRIMDFATQEMLIDVQNIDSFLDHAYNNAKNILEQQVLTYGKLTGKSYTIEWVEDPSDIQQSANSTEAVGE